MKILVAEPDEYYHRLFQDHISPVAELQFTGRGEEIMRLLTGDRFDLLITELLYTDGHAYDFLPKIQRTPVVIYTRIGHLEDVEASLNLGVMGYFVKGHDTINDVKKLILNLYSPFTILHSTT